MCAAGSDRHLAGDAKFYLISVTSYNTVAQKTVPMFCQFEQTCTNLTLALKPALEKNRGDSTASYLQFGVLHARFEQKLTEK